jgi:5-methylcytosine-specific restriction endonuclease McrA
MRQYTRWTPQRDEQLKTLYPTKKQKELAEALQTTAPSVSWRIQKLKLTRNVSGEGKRWTEREISAVKELYPKKTAQEIGKILNRSVHGVRSWIRKLGLKSDRSPPKPIKNGIPNHIRYYRRNRETILEKQATRRRRYYHDDPNFREKRKAKSKAHHWVETKRQELLEKYDRKCARCGYSEFESSLCVHHINGPEDEENLILLCMNCHRALHIGLWNLDSLEA